MPPGEGVARTVGRSCERIETDETVVWGAWPSPQEWVPEGGFGCLYPNLGDLVGALLELCFWPRHNKGGLSRDLLELLLYITVC